MRELPSTEFLNTCTERQLFVFIEATLTALVEEQERAPLWANEQEELVIQAMEKTTSRFGVPRTKADFDQWYRENRWGWFQALSHDEFISALKEMPWNQKAN